MRQSEPIVVEQAPPSRHAITIERWHPASLNRLMRMHWSKRNRVLQSDAHMVAVYAMLAKVPRATGKRRVTQVLTLAGNDRKRDDDNAWKSLLDALVGAGLLVDDSTRWVEKAPLRFERASERATTILLEDV